MLGRPFELDGVVVAGDQRGGTLGYPTANLRLEPELACPRYGIYAGSASGIVRRSRSARTRTTAAPSGGSSRISSTSRATCTGSGSCVELWERLRDEAVFESEAELVEQIASDVEATKLARRP